MNKHVITALILIAALALYALGAVLPATVLIVIGAGFELWFWLRVFRRPGNRDE